jgi:hypothetical protein
MTKTRTHERNDSGAGWHGGSFAAADPHRIRRAILFVIACGLFLAGSAKSLPETDGSVEYPVKLAFLYNFTKFVEWPPQSYRDAAAPLSICVVGDDPFRPELEQELRTRTVEGHVVEVRALKPSDTLNGCHMVFIPVTANEQAARIVKGLDGTSTLTVGETAGFAESGGIINLMVEGNTIHIEVNLTAADRAGLKISSKLLSIAKISDGKEMAHAVKN